MVPSPSLTPMNICMSKEKLQWMLTHVSTTKSFDKKEERTKSNTLSVVMSLWEREREINNTGTGDPNGKEKKRNSQVFHQPSSQIVPRNLSAGEVHLYYPKYSYSSQGSLYLYNKGLYKGLAWFWRVGKPDKSLLWVVSRLQSFPCLDFSLWSW